MTKFERIVAAATSVELLVAKVNEKLLENKKQKEIATEIVAELQKIDPDVSGSESTLFNGIRDCNYSKSTATNQFTLISELKAKELTLDEYKFFNQDFKRNWTGKFDEELFKKFERTIKALYPNVATYKVLNLMIKEFLEKENPNDL